MVATDLLNLATSYCMKSLRITPPEEFNYKLALSFLERSPRELLHYVVDERIEKAIRIDDKIVVFSIEHNQGELVVDILNATLSDEEELHVIQYIREWMDLDTDLKPFYALCAKDRLLKPLVRDYYGYRIVGQPDLFESIVWAIIGQQINLQFAYTLKQRFVEKFGESVNVDGKTYYLFPAPSVVAELSAEELLTLQFSRQKAAYAIAVGRAFNSGEISKEKVQRLPFDEAKTFLMRVKGIGNWTANYALMKTFRHANAFPLEDAGIHNAIKILKKLDKKPSLDEVRKVFRKYKGWEAYATLYLWKSL